MNLANALHDRHRVTADPADLDRAIDHYREAAGLRAPEDPRTAGVLSNLGLALRRRYATTGNPQDLDDAVESGWAAAESAWEADVAGPATTIYLDALAGSLNMRWELTGDSDDLDQLITVSRLLAVAVPCSATCRSTPPVTTPPVGTPPARPFSIGSSRRTPRRSGPSATRGPGCESLARLG